VIAYAEIEEEGEKRREELEKDLTFLAIVGMEDKVREGVPEAVILAQRAGVVVRMVTGDSLETSIKVAKHCNLLPSTFTYPSNGFYVMEGKDFRQYVGGLVTTKDDDGKVTHSVRDLQAFEEVVGELRVLARSSPEDKFLLVCGLKQCGHVVAVTGDGSNDAPALRKADVGISMNIVGTPLAKEAADILLMNDNFASIITAIKWGRNIYDCVRKFLQFQLTTNIVALIVCFIGAVISEETPLSAVQMLWVNMIMDSFAALALATESPSDELLSRPPYSRSESIITPDMWLTILSMAIYQIIWLAVIFFLGDALMSLHGVEENTFFFHTFVLLQVFNEINCRKLKASQLNVFKGITKQPIFNIIFFGTIICQMLLVQFGGDPVGCEPLSWKQHALCFAIGASTLPAAFLIKVGPTLYRRANGDSN
jgi:Ca2+ transporting ATPase